MHYRAEIVIPPTSDVEAAIELVLRPFDENGKDDEGDDAYMRRYAFWDWYVIGGRWSGQKALDGLDRAKLDEFEEWLRAEKITVSGLIAGKQELSPPSQALKVDAKWNEMFPSSDGELARCPLFQHAGESLPGDVLPLGRCGDVTASVVIVAGPSWNSATDMFDGPLKAELMLRRQIWNGVNWQDTTWDGKLASAIEQHAKRVEGYRVETRDAFRTNDEWLVVTVDYHN